MKSVTLTGSWGHRFLLEMLYIGYKRMLFCLNPEFSILFKEKRWKIGFRNSDNSALCYFDFLFISVLEDTHSL